MDKKKESRKQKKIYRDIILKKKFKSVNVYYQKYQKQRREKLTVVKRNLENSKQLNYYNNNRNNNRNVINLKDNIDCNIQQIYIDENIIENKKKRKLNYINLLNETDRNKRKNKNNKHSLTVEWDYENPCKK